MIKEFETLGFYEPGFLHLRVNTNTDISDLNKLASNKKMKKYFSTFLHEYIHFLQDVTTTSGLMAAKFYIEFIKDINSKILHDKKAEFKVPVKITNTNNIEANLKLREIYRGDTRGSTLLKYNRYSIEYPTIKDKNNKIIKPPKYIVHYYDLITRESKSLHFGFACLKEYMAHAIQKKYIPETEHKDIPYQIAEQIIATEYPDFGNDSMLFVALCDASLMSFHPAQMFFNLIERMKKESFIPKSAIDIYKFSFKDLSFKGEIGTETVESLFEKIVKQTDTNFFDALQSAPFLPNYNWLKHILIEAKKLRLSNPSFITELVTEKGKLSQQFYEIFSNIGSPFFTNKTNIGGFVPPNELKEKMLQPYQLLVFKQIINIFNGHQNCSLYDFCKTRPDTDITNNLCKTAPWKRANEKVLCPFAQLWRTWGLTNKVPIKGN